MSSLAPGITDIATYLPEGRLENDELVARFGFEPEFLDSKVGIHSRRIAGPDEAVSDMAVSAAEILFDRGEVRPDEVDLLIICTQNPDYCLPTTANLVQDRLGLRDDTAAFDINQGCSGYIYGLSVAKSMMASEDLRCALFITSEAYSKVMDPNDRYTVPLFGDGAAATLIRAGGQGRIGRFTFGTDGSGADSLIVRGGGSRHPDLPRKGESALYMNGRAVYNFMIKRVPPSLEDCVARNGITFADIDYFVFHQASRFMINALIKRLNLDPEKVPIIMSEIGNTVSSTIPITIEAMGGPAALKGKRVLISGFGVGLSWGATVIQF